jgi:hypothetical protein
MTTKITSCLAAFAFAAAAMLPAAAANLIIYNGNAPGVGFNDTTPAAPVGGNPGVTLGQQRLNAFAFAASIWGQQLQSKVDIAIFAVMEPLPCSANSAVLGAAGPTSVFRDFDGAPVRGHWYHVALANKLAGEDLDPGFAHIVAFFNSELGKATCLAGSPFYLGLDNRAGTAIDLVTVLLHEFGHGLGFSTTTEGDTGVQLVGFPSIYDKFTYDNTLRKAWNQMTDPERQFSALNARNVVWTGARVTSAAEDVLKDGTPRLTIKSPDEIAGIYLVGSASFGPRADDDGETKKVAQVIDQPNGTGLACTPLNAANAKEVKSRIALVDRGVCGFVVKAKNVQVAGAKAMIVVDNVASNPPAEMSGVDPTIKIPSVRVTLATGNAIKGALHSSRSRNSDVQAKIDVDEDQLAGADKRGRVMLFSPNPYQGGSSISHWDSSAFHNLLMEPFINADLAHSVKPPKDLTLPFMKDIGW